MTPDTPASPTAENQEQQSGDEGQPQPPLAELWRLADLMGAKVRAHLTREQRQRKAEAQQAEDGVQPSRQHPEGDA
ncbi:hypothetical protein ABZS86_05480 [Streptomyces sp. NPDC005355]|uniref:hypothetical protein n=1 Tax=Streptomyces sp. NPDC005355 TaxID=3157038 RepID=UPI0033BEA34B